MASNILTQSSNSVQALTFTVKSGPHFNPAIGEYEVWFDGEITTYATDYGTATRLYYEVLSTRREHAQRNPANAIPFQGEPGEAPQVTAEWQTYGLQVEA